MVWRIGLSVLSVTAAVVAGFVALWTYRLGKRVAVKEATDLIFNQWWHDDLDKLRYYFFRDFLPKHRAKLVGKSMKEIKDVVPEDKGRAKSLCFFFDKVGWLGAAKLIDVDNVLGPMQHVMRRTWTVMEPLIKAERELSPNKNFDPVYQCGFEWLYRRSCLPKKNQADLVRHGFHDPDIRTAEEIEELRAQIHADEKNFERRLEQILCENRGRL